VSVPLATVSEAIAVTPRSLAEYRDMFLLSDADLVAGSILDCPGGASPFGAQVRARGGTVVSVDPAYDTPGAAIVDRVAYDQSRILEWMHAHLGQFNWSYLGSPAALARAWETAADLFAADYAPDELRYVAAALPLLPFPDDHFTLALSGFLLFTYPEHLSFGDHVAGILELARVTRGEARLYPITDSGGAVHPRLDELRRTLAERGVDSEIRPAGCAWSPGGDRMLACHRAG